MIITDSGRKYAKTILTKIYEAEEEAFLNTKDTDKLLELAFS